MEVIELSNVPVVPAPTFEVGEFVREGDWACEVLAPACGRGFYPVRRIFDDEARYAVVHESELEAADLTEDELLVCHGL